MKDVSFYEIILAKEDQRIVSASAEIYNMLGSRVVKPFNELIAIEDMDIYENNIKNCDGTFHPSKILAPDTMYFTYISAVRYNDDLIRLTVVNAQDLVNSHATLMRTISASKAQLSLYEDIFFEYNPKRDSIYVYNTELADFETGTYSLSEFEDILLTRTDDEQRQTVKSFIAQVKSGAGRNTAMIEGNILNDDELVTHTVLEEAFVFYDKDNEGVVGHIQLRRGRESIKPTMIKHDSLTGLVEKADIIRIARERIDDKHLEGTSLAIIDVDFFKNINDSYGHQFGDDVIKKVADIVSSEVGDNGISGRFGGDEFFAVLYNIESEEQIRSILKGIKTRVTSTFPDMGVDKDSPLSVSIGAATYSKDAENYDDLFMLADHCLYLAKEKGRNRFIIYTPEKHGFLEEIRNKQQNSKLVNERDTTYADFIVKMLESTLHDENVKVEDLLSEFAEAFGLQNVNLYVGSPFVHKCSAGSEIIVNEEASEMVLDILNSDIKDKYFSLGDFVVVNRLESLPPHAHNLKGVLHKIDVYAFIIIRFYDKDKKECIFIMASVGRKNLWNQTLFKYYRAFTDILSLHSL
jgi:diguanylate cyclase (GGDEF)-like protein